MSKEYNVAILGATGAVGTRMIQQLEQSTIPVKSVKLLASAKSAGKQLSLKANRLLLKRLHLILLRGLILCFHLLVDQYQKSSFQKQ